MYQRLTAHKVNAVTYDKADFSSFHSKKNFKMILKLLHPLLPPSADKFPSLCCCEKSKQPQTTCKIFLSGVFLMKGGGRGDVHLIPVYQPGESFLVFLVN